MNFSPYKSEKYSVTVESITLQLLVDQVIKIVPERVSTALMLPGWPKSKYNLTKKAKASGE